MKLSSLRKVGVSIVALAIAGAFTAGIAQAGCLDDVKAKGVLKSGNGVMGLKPWVWQNEDGSYTGMEWELFQAIADKLGVKPEYEITEWTTLIPGLKSGRWDIILSSMAVTEERKEGGGIDFTNPYFLLYDYVIVPGDSPIQSWDDLKGKKLASTLGSTDSISAHWLVDQGYAAEVLDFNTYTEPFVAVQRGQADAVVLDQASFIGQKEVMKDLRTVGEPINYMAKPEWKEKQDAAPYILGATAIGVRTECQDLKAAINQALDELEKDGTRQKLLEKYEIWADDQKLSHLMKQD
jgi:ABC-type amino acid transport substrate-binding protein